MLAVRDEHPRAARADAKVDRLRTEAREQRHVDRARLERAEHRDERLGHAAEIAGDAIAGRHAQLAKDAGEPCAEPGQLSESVPLDHAVAADPRERDLIRRRVAVDQLAREIHSARGIQIQELQHVLPAEAPADLVVRRWLDHQASVASRKR